MNFIPTQSYTGPRTPEGLTMTKTKANKERRKSGKRKASRKRKVLKSAGSGRFVSKKFAKKHPRTTYAERIDLNKFRCTHDE
jgi:hypothetical protein